MLKLARPEHLAKLAPDAFDYVIVDEVHHAAADSYRRILDRLRPAFLLGLTATPERADGGDVLGLFDDHVAYRADLGEGVDRWLLVWEVPELDFPAWRELGGRTASRRLPEGLAGKAERVIEDLLARPDVSAPLRITGRAPRGGLRVAGDFRERTVSVLDIAWVLAARERFEVVDEAAVNRLRYLSGTPRASTRFIDTGIAIRLVAGWASHVGPHG